MNFDVAIVPDDIKPLHEYIKAIEFYSDGQTVRYVELFIPQGIIFNIDLGKIKKSWRLDITLGFIDTSKSTLYGVLSAAKHIKLTRKEKQIETVHRNELKE